MKWMMNFKLKIMKQIFIKYGLLVALFALIVGCEQDLPIFDSDEAWVSFNSDSSRAFSFIYADNPHAEYDTVAIEVMINGNPVDYDREVSIIQIKDTDETIKDAEAGVHYLAFSDPNVQKSFIIPAGKMKADIKVILKNDSSLDEEDVLLAMEIVDNEYFKAGFNNNNRVYLTISNQYAQPLNWNAQTNVDFGNYSNELLEFLILVTGEKWDYDYLLTIGYIEPEAYNPYPMFPSYVEYRYTNSDIYDSQYIGYLVNILKEKLIEENDKREQAGKPIWNITFN